MAFCRPDLYRLGRIQQRDGRSFELAWRAAERAPERFEVRLVHGHVRDCWSLLQISEPRRFRWAWLEFGGRAYCPVVDVNIPADMFERQFDPSAIVRYSVIEAARLVLSTRHTGPWDARVIDLPKYWPADPRP